MHYPTRERFLFTFNGEAPKPLRFFCYIKKIYIALLMEECGRRRQLTKIDEMDAKKKSFIEAMKSSLGNITKACESLGISRQTYYNWLEDEEFKSEIDNIDEYVIDFAEHSLFRQIQENNTTATIFYLKTKGKHRGYVEKQEIDHSGSLGIVWKEERTYQQKDEAND